MPFLPLLHPTHNVSYKQNKAQSSWKIAYASLLFSKSHMRTFHWHNVNCIQDPSCKGVWKYCLLFLLACQALQCRKAYYKGLEVNVDYQQTNLSQKGSFSSWEIGATSANTCLCCRGSNSSQGLIKPILLTKKM